MINIRKIKPYRDDIILCRVPKEDMENNYIHLLGDGQDENPLQYFEVIAKGDQCLDSFDVGDTVVLPWTRISDPMYGSLDGIDRQFGVTAEKEVLAVIDS